MSSYLRCYLVIPLYHLSLKHTYYLMRSSLWVVNEEEKHRYDLQMNQYGMQIPPRRNVCESHWCSGQNILQHICLCITVEENISWSTSIHEQSPTCWLGIWRNQNWEISDKRFMLCVFEEGRDICINLFEWAECEEINHLCTYWPEGIISKEALSNQMGKIACSFLTVEHFPQSPSCIFNRPMYKVYLVTGIVTVHGFNNIIVF